MAEDGNFQHLDNGELRLAERHSQKQGRRITRLRAISAAGKMKPER